MFNKTQGIDCRFVVGFACILSFLYSLFYTGKNTASYLFGFEIERVDLLFTLLFMTLGFVLFGRASKRARSSYFSVSTIWCHALLMVLGAAVALPLRYGLSAIVLEGFLVGFSYAAFICAWGDVLGSQRSNTVPSTIMLSTLLAAFVCLAVNALSLLSDYAFGILSFLPLLSAFFLTRLIPDDEKSDTAEDASIDQSRPWHGLIALGTNDTLAQKLSSTTLAGTCMFGVAAGFMETFGTDPGMSAVQAFPATLLFLILLCIALLQLLGTREKAVLESSEASAVALSEAYRLSVLVMMAGFLLAYVLADFKIPGESIVLAGYLGLFAVLVCLFIMLSQLYQIEASVWFGRGFGTLYFGEFIGLILGNVVEISDLAGNPPYIIAAIAGIASLYAYQFLFPEKHFVSIATMVNEQDKFKELCLSLSSTYGLSARESEILPFILKGRTSERIASELYISKSTVDTHIKRIYAKCGVHSRQELIDLREQSEGVIEH